MNPDRIKSLDRRLYGVCVGLVEDNEDPGKEGRIKVRFPWLDDRTTSEWCRVCHPYAGPGYGVVFTPEVGDEVLVAFMHGEMSEPVIVGGLHNGKDQPPTYKQQTQKDQKVIRTKAGHQLLFDDSAGARKVAVATADARSCVFDDQGQKIAIETHGLKVTLDDGAGTITLEVGASTVSLDRSGNISIKGTAIKIAGSQISIG